MGYLVYFNVVRAKEIVNSSYNERQNNFAEQVVRGNITDRNGNFLAETQLPRTEVNTAIIHTEMYSRIVGTVIRIMGKMVWRQRKTLIF